MIGNCLSVGLSRALEGVAIGNRHSVGFSGVLVGMAIGNHRERAAEKDTLTMLQTVCPGN